MNHKTDVFTFNPGPNVKRKVVIEIPPQANGNALEVVAGKLPASTPLPPKEKRFTLIRRIIEPVVRIKHNKKQVFTFSPPLRVTIYFSAADAALARRATGTPANQPPRLSIITSYKKGSKWQWHRMKTKVICDNRSCNSGRLIAESLSKLHPKDPLDEGSP